MSLLGIVVLAILVGFTFAIIVISIVKSLLSKKQAPVEVVLDTAKIDEEKLKLEEEALFEEIAVIMAAIEAYKKDDVLFHFRKIIRKEDGSLLWNSAGIKQNNDSSIYNVNA